MKFNQKLIILRKKNKLSQEDVAKLLNIGQTTYSRYENLLTYPDIFTVKKIAELYKISIDELLNEVENEKINIILEYEEARLIKEIAKKIDNIQTIKNNNIKGKNIIIGNYNKIKK